MISPLSLPGERFLLLAGVYERRKSLVSKMLTKYQLSSCRSLAPTSLFLQFDFVKSSFLVWAAALPNQTADVPHHWDSIERIAQQDLHVDRSQAVIVGSRNLYIPR